MVTQRGEGGTLENDDGAVEIDVFDDADGDHRGICGDLCGAGKGGGSHAGRRRLQRRIDEGREARDVHVNTPLSCAG